MRTNESRNIKIDLQIIKNRENLLSPVNCNSKIQIRTTKSTNNRKKLNVSIHNKSNTHNNSKATLIIPPQKILVS